MSQKSVYQLSVRQILLIAFLSATFAAVGVAGFSYFGNRVAPVTVAEETDNTFNNEVAAGISDPQTVSDEQNNIEVYKSISPGVAFITSTSTQEDYFGNEREGSGGSGSGSVMDTNGHILTNAHVVEGAQKLSVKLGGDKNYPAKIIGIDPDTDLAVIKIEAPREALTIVPFGDSDNLTVGQKVLAIGNPFGLDRTLTTGVISGLQRPIRGINGKPIEGAVQTDASINPGNSGGPLLDSRGRMIGVNSQIYSRSGGSVGIGFAVPVSIAKRVVPQLLQFGEVRRPKLGVSAVGVKSLRAQGLNLPVEEGLFIRSVLPGSSAERSGLRGLTQSAGGDVVLGDIITQIEGEKVEDLDDLYRALDKKQIGETLQVEVFRDNKRSTVQIKLLAPPNNAGRTTPQQITPNRRF